MIYLDNAATTRIRDEVLDEMLPFLKSEYGNPSALYGTGREARAAVEKARERVASALGAASPREIFFTSCGSEADNWALSYAGTSMRIITDATEHHAILNTCAAISKRGGDIRIAEPDRFGVISENSIAREIPANGKCLVSVMLVNNEVGAVNPVADIAKAAKSAGAVVHTDAVQAVGHMDVDVVDLGVDMASVSAHKFYGPKGVGALYVRKGITLAPFIYGGAQEKQHRAGTENVASIVGMGKAIELAAAETEMTAAHDRELGMRLANGIMAAVPGARLNGPREMRVWSNVSITFENMRTETLLVNLDAAGIACSGGSACAAGSLEPSHVLTAMYGRQDRQNATIRFTVGRYNTVDEIDETIKTLVEIFGKMRR